MGARKRYTPLSTVTIARVAGTRKTAIEHGVARVLQSFGGIEKIIPAHVKRLLIKPNLMMGKSWKTGITVHPYVIEALIKEIKKADLDVVVGEGAGWGGDSLEAFRTTGVAELCRQLEVDLVGCKRGKSVRVPVPDSTILEEITVDEIALECDFIISLAKMKTHCETIVSLSLKNMKGLVSEDIERLRYHLLDVNRCLVDLNKTFKPGFALVEGIIGL